MNIFGVIHSNGHLWILLSFHESQADDIPGSGLTISDARRRQLLGEDSEDEVTESISELPSFTGGTKARKRPTEVRECTQAATYRTPKKPYITQFKFIYFVNSCRSLNKTVFDYNIF